MRTLKQCVSYGVPPTLHSTPTVPPPCPASKMTNETQKFNEPQQQSQNEILLYTMRWGQQSLELVSEEYSFFSEEASGRMGCGRDGGN